MARGLGVPRIITNLLHVYDAAGDNLVLIIGVDERENKWIGDSMFGNKLTRFIGLILSMELGLVEQAVISEGTKARGLSIVNTDAMTVGTRYMTIKSQLWET